MTLQEILQVNIKLLQELQAGNINLSNISLNGAQLDNINSGISALKEDNQTMPINLKYGQGSITVRKIKKPSGEIYKYYQGSIYKNGVRHYITAKTQQKCADKLKELRESLTPENQKIITGHIKYSDWINKWFELYKSNNKKSSKRTDKSHIEYHILPKLGNIRLNKLTTSNIQEALNDITTPNTRHKVYLIINSSLKKACATNVLKYNPCLAVMHKKIKTEPTRPFEFEEQTKMLNSLKPPYQAVFFFLCCTGLRVGEFLGLSTKHIDYDRKIINIVNALDSVEKTLEGVKTETSKRKVAFCQPLIDYIEKRMDLTTFFSKFSYDGIKKAFKTAFIKNNIENVSIRATRNTFASICYNVGIPDKQTQKWLGHATRAMTEDIYTELLNKGDSPIKQYILELKELID